MRCVRQDLITAGRPGARLSPGTYGTFDATAWQSFPADSGGVYTGQFAWSDWGVEGPPLVGTLHAVSAQAVRTPHLSTAYVEDLIEAFGPTIQLYPGGYHSGEYYYPDDPQYVLDHSVLQWGTVQNEWNYGSFALNLLGELPTSASTLTADAAYAQTFNDPPDPSFRTWIKIPEPTSGHPQSPATGDLITGNLARARVLVRARTWNAVFTEIQFWLYYPFNGAGRFHLDADPFWDQHVQMDTCGRHYSDWEHVSVLFQAGVPVALYLSRHDGDVWISRKDFGFLWDRGVHPVIYAGKFSHAHYTTIGTHAYKRVFSISDFYVDLEDYTGAGDVLQTHDPATYWFASSAIAGVDPSDPEPAWLQFPGRWGQYEKLRFEYIFFLGFWPISYTQTEIGAGPSGPAMKDSWQQGDWCLLDNSCQ